MAQEAPKLTALRGFVTQQPNDPFPRYGLAMELKSTGNLDEAWQCFSQLIEKHPSYLASYAPAGDLLATLGRIEDARAIYSKGIAIAGQQGNHHSRDLLEDALSNLASVTK